MTGATHRTAPAGATRALWAAVAVFLATIAQLVVATVATGLPQFAGKAFGARLVAYPLLMLAVPAVWAMLPRRSRSRTSPPWAGFALIMSPFLIDVTGNTLNLYDTIAWWDDANHLVNWFLLSAGIGLLLKRTQLSPPWMLALVVTGVGSVLALLWEVGEWYTFVRHGTELATAYEDTLGDQALGTVGAALAGILAARRRHQVRSSDTA